MNRIIFIAGIMFFTILTGCKPDAKKAIDKAEEIAKEYINDLNNAKTKEEVQELRKECKFR